MTVPKQFKEANQLLLEGDEMSSTALYSEFYQKFKRKFTKEIYGRTGNCNMGAIDLFLFIESRIAPFEKLTRGLMICFGMYDLGDESAGHSWVEIDGDILDPTGKLQFGNLSDSNYHDDGHPKNNALHIAGWQRYASTPEDTRLKIDENPDFDYEENKPKQK